MAQQKISYGFKTKKEDGSFSDEIKFATTTDLVKDNNGNTAENRIKVLEQHGIERIIITDIWTIEPFSKEDYGMLATSEQYGFKLSVQDRTTEDTRGYVHRVVIYDSEKFEGTDTTIDDVQNGNSILAKYLWPRGNDFNYSLEGYYGYLDETESLPSTRKYQIPILYTDLNFSAANNGPYTSQLKLDANVSTNDWIISTDGGRLWMQIIITRPLNK